MLNINISGRNGVPSPGVYREAGKCGNLPSGEAYIAPLEDGSDGEMIIDGSMVGIGKLESPLHMTISGGKLRSVTGEKSENLDILLKNEINGTVCELGIGTNEAAILNGIILEDEKVYGTVHIALVPTLLLAEQTKQNAIWMESSCVRLYIWMIQKLSKTEFFLSDLFLNR